MANRDRLNLTVIVMTVVVCVAGAVVGGAFGFLASILYDASYALSAIAGGGSGVLVGWGWSALMARKTRLLIPGYGRVPGRIVGDGILLGLAAGTVSTLVVHSGLAAWTGSVNIRAIGGFVVAFGLPAGFVTGLICGLIWWVACGAAYRQDQGNTTASVEGS